MDPPETRYATVGDADIAYQVVGDGPFDLVHFYGLGSHLDLDWDHPAMAAFLRRLASFCRLILFDRRGTGLSDRFSRNALPTWEEWADDITAVLDAVGSDRAALSAALDAGPLAMLFAAMHPERVSALVLTDTWARLLVADDYPVGVSQDLVDLVVDLVSSTWGTPQLLRAAQPGYEIDEPTAEWWARRTRAAATPRTAAAQYRRIYESDVRQALPLIRVPTLVLHHQNNPLVPIGCARFTASHIAGSRFVELPGAHMGPTIFTPDQFLEEVAVFLTGQRPAVEIDRILTTVLFTDIVKSTERLALLGDGRWRSLLDAHDRTVREQIQRFRGREIKTTGDGFLASFDGPARAIRCARAINEAMSPLGIEVRAGLHIGECEVRGDDLAGLAVHIAARVGALAGPGEVLVSRTVADLVAGSGIEFDDRGEHELKGVPGSCKLFAVVG